MKPNFSSVVGRIIPSPIRTMGLRAARYENVISLGIGEPDFHTPHEVCQGALQDAMEGATHYTPSQGDPELLEALQGYLENRFGYGLSRENIIITIGGIGALAALFRTVLNPGDAVLVPEPHFPAYRYQTELAGGEVVYVHTTHEQGFALTAEAVERSITPHSKVLILNAPNNPTGAVISSSTLDDLAALAKERDLLVISDEVYDRLLFDGLTHESIYSRPGMPERTVVIGSFSKAFAMTGWRLGYAFGPDWLIREMVKVVMYYTSCAPSVSQRAALAALRMSPSFFESMVEEFRERRELIFDKLSQIPGIEVNKPAGSFYIFPNIETITKDTEAFAIDLVDEEKVVVVPGGAFGPSGTGCIRMAFTVDQSRLAEAMERFARFIERKAR